MKLSIWAKEQGISYITAWRWIKADKMPVHWSKTPTGMILVHPEKEVNASALPTYTYSRVSSSKQKADLARQSSRISAFCEANGWAIANEFKEVASGMNDKRAKLLKMLELPAGRLVVENKDRLTRFGFNYLEVLMTKLGWEIVVINQAETDEADILADLTSIITSFCCRIYGLRRGHKRAKQINDSIK